MPRLYFSYRQADTEWASVLLRASLDCAFGARAVAKDLAERPRGAQRRIKRAVDRCDAMVVAIGPRWVEEFDRHRYLLRRDWVAFEIGRAIARGKPIFTVLLEDADWPRAHLPPDLAPLNRLPPWRIDDRDDLDFETIATAFIGSIRHALERETGSDRQAPEPPTATAATPAPDVADNRGADHERAVVESPAVQLAPILLPAIPGFDLSAAYHAAHPFNGTCYDVNPLGCGRFALLVATASGSGQAAAMLASKLRTIVRCEAPRRRGPRDLLATVNRQIAPKIPPGGFINVMYAELNRDSAELVTANATHSLTDTCRNRPNGNPPPPAGVTIRPECELLTNLFLDEHRRAIAPGETLLMYNDGLIEAIGAESPAHAHLLVSRCAVRAATAAEITERVVSLLHAFVYDRRKGDAALIALRCAGHGTASHARLAPAPPVVARGRYIDTAATAVAVETDVPSSNASVGWWFDRYTLRRY